MCSVYALIHYLLLLVSKLFFFCLAMGYMPQLEWWDMKEYILLLLLLIIIISHTRRMHSTDLYSKEPGTIVVVRFWRNILSCIIKVCKQASNQWEDDKLAKMRVTTSRWSNQPIYRRINHTVMTSLPLPASLSNCETACSRAVFIK